MILYLGSQAIPQKPILTGNIPDLQYQCPWPGSSAVPESEETLAICCVMNPGMGEVHSWLGPYTYSPRR